MRKIEILLVAIAFLLAGCQGQSKSGLNTTSSRGRGVSLTVRVESAPWSSDGSIGERLSTKNYDIYTTARNPMIRAYLPGFMEGAYLNYLSLSRLPDKPSAQKMPIYMMGNRPEWAVLTKNVIHANQQEAYLAIEAGGYCYKGVCVFWDMGGLGTFSVAAHEGLHQFLFNRLTDRLPMWAEEGLCVSAEGHEIFNGAVRFTPDQNVSRLTSLRSAILKEYWMPIEQILPLDAGDLSITTTERAVAYYAQLWALSRMLRNSPTYGPGFRRMFADAEAGTMHKAMGVPPHAMAELRKRGRLYNRTVSKRIFKYYITEDIERFDKEFMAYARQIASLQ